MAEVVGDLRDLLAEAQKDQAGSLRADRRTQESLENLIKVIVAVLRPHIAARLSAWRGKVYPVSQAMNWIVEKVRSDGQIGHRPSKDPRKSLDIPP